MRSFVAVRAVGASSCFFVGPKRQYKIMFTKDRAPASAGYLICVVLVIGVAFGVRICLCVRGVQ